MNIGPMLRRRRCPAPLHRDPHRIDALPSMVSSPPCAVAPADWKASPHTRTFPDIMFSATPGPTEPSTRTVPPWFIQRRSNRRRPGRLHLDLVVHAHRDGVRAPRTSTT
ncbi:hypothetical protein HBB16_19515 [Pseudonocardia sp. MCCB 268]|nr:hypothetical protein [Pseudonocardia cytotoxica]